MDIVLYDIRRPLSPGEKSCLSPARLARSQKFRFEEDRARCLAAGYLIEHVLRVPEESLIKGEFGKLYGAESPTCYFNVSHAGNYVVLVQASHEVGVDVELVGGYDRRVAKKCYTPEEMEWLDTQHSDEAFYRLWTAKESIMKATGRGFDFPPESFSVLPMDETPHTIDNRLWYLHWLLYQDHVICSAVEQEREQTDVRCIE
ncbi:MAG: 4'-phosphopantetheinyl transferase superfamily protein [Raoultibacter sp.]